MLWNDLEEASTSLQVVSFIEETLDRKCVEIQHMIANGDADSGISARWNSKDACKIVLMWDKRNNTIRQVLDWEIGFGVVLHPWIQCALHATKMNIKTVHPQNVCLRSASRECAWNDCERHNKCQAIYHHQATCSILRFLSKLIDKLSEIIGLATDQIGIAEQCFGYRAVVFVRELDVSLQLQPASLPRKKSSNLRREKLFLKKRWFVALIIWNVEQQVSRRRRDG
jgi:hypothetical protein